MRRVYATTFALVTAFALATVSAQQQPPAQPPAGGGQRMGGGGDAARKVPGGGIHASGWKGKVDAFHAVAFPYLQQAAIDNGPMILADEGERRRVAGP